MIPRTGRHDSVAPNRTPPSDTPNEVIPDRSNSVSPLRCLNLAASLQTNLGAPSSRRECGSRPSFRDSENRSSAFADCEPSASSLHHRGQAALIAGSLSPKVLRRCLNCVALSVSRKTVSLWSLFPLYLRALMILAHSQNACLKRYGCFSRLFSCVAMHPEG